VAAFGFSEKYVPKQLCITRTCCIFEKVMKMNNFAASIGVLAMFGLASCDKTISPDSPLPPVYRPVVIMPTANGIIYGMAANTGEKLYEYRGTDSTTIAVSSDLLTHNITVDSKNLAYCGVGQYSGVNAGTAHVECFDAGNGQYKWRAQLRSVPSAAFTVVDDRLVVPQGDSVYAVGIADGNKGQILWRWGSGSATNRVSGSILLHDGLLYLLTSGGAPGGATVHCLKPSDGTLFTQTGLVNQNPYSLSTGNFDARTSIGAGNNRLYVTFDNVSNGAVVCLNKRLEVIGTATNPEVWTYNILGKSNYTSPLVYGDMVVVGAHDYNIHCIDGTAGVSSIRWKFPTSERINSSATVDAANENIVIGSNDFNLYAINFVDGKLRWKFPTASMIVSSPVVYDGKIYFNSLDKYLYCINAASGTLVWKHQLNIVPVSTGTAAVSVASPVVCDMKGNSYYPSVSGNSQY
jgi:eukaryotic-like serine/threonine-protein kinase